MATRPVAISVDVAAAGRRPGGSPAISVDVAAAGRRPGGWTAGVNAQPSPLLTGALCEVGMTVLANYNGAGRYHPGRITSIELDETCTVVYEDGDGTWTEQGVPLERIKLVPGSPVRLPSELSSLRAGSACEVNFNGVGRWYTGTVTRIHQLQRPTTFDASLEDQDGTFEATNVSVVHIRPQRLTVARGGSSTEAQRRRSRSTAKARAGGNASGSGAILSSSSSGGGSTSARWTMRPALQLREGMTVEVRGSSVKGGSAPPHEWLRGAIVAIAPECIGYGICRPRLTTVECDSGALTNGIKDGEIRLVPNRGSLQIGDRVDANYHEGGEFRSGKIVGIHTGTTYDVSFRDEGEGLRSPPRSSSPCGRLDPAAESASLEASFEKVELGETEHNVRRDLLRVSVVDARPMKVDPAGGGLMRRPSRDAFAAYSRATAAEAALKTLRIELNRAREDVATLSASAASERRAHAAEIEELRCDRSAMRKETEALHAQVHACVNENAELKMKVKNATLLKMKMEKKDKEEAESDPPSSSSTAGESEALRAQLHAYASENAELKRKLNALTGVDPYAVPSGRAQLPATSPSPTRKSPRQLKPLHDAALRPSTGETPVLFQP